MYKINQRAAKGIWQILDIKKQGSESGTLFFVCGILIS